MKISDRVVYIGGPRSSHVGTIVNITDKRVIVKWDKYPWKQILKAKNLEVITEDR